MRRWLKFLWYIYFSKPEKFPKYPGLFMTRLRKPRVSKGRLVLKQYFHSDWMKIKYALIDNATNDKLWSEVSIIKIDAEFMFLVYLYVGHIAPIMTMGFCCRLLAMCFSFVNTPREACTLFRLFCVAYSIYSPTFFIKKKAIFLRPHNRPTFSCMLSNGVVTPFIHCPHLILIFKWVLHLWNGTLVW